MNENRINWIDVETTGLHQDCELLEMALVVTDNNLKVLGQATAVIHQPPSVLETMNDWCTKTHTASGLVKECQESETNIEQAEAMLLSVMEECGSLGQILGGASVHFDRRVLRQHCPNLESQGLHYRNFDVSVIKQAVLRWWPGMVELPPSKDVHRALPDILESIEHAKWFREHLMLNPKALAGRPYIS